MSEVVVTTVDEVVVVSTKTIIEVIETAAEQGPPGRDGSDVVSISDKPDNQLSAEDDGLYVPATAWALKEW